MALCKLRTYLFWRFKNTHINQIFWSTQRKDPLPKKTHEWNYFRPSENRLILHDSWLRMNPPERWASRHRHNTSCRSLWLEEVPMTRPPSPSPSRPTLEAPTSRGRLSNTHPPTGTHSSVRQANCRHPFPQHVTCHYAISEWDQNCGFDKESIGTILRAAVGQVCRLQLRPLGNLLARLAWHVTSCGAGPPSESNRGSGIVQRLHYLGGSPHEYFRHTRSIQTYSRNPVTQHHIIK